MSCAQTKRFVSEWCASDVRHHGPPCPGSGVWHRVRGHRVAVASTHLYIDTKPSEGGSYPHQSVPHVCMPPGSQRVPIPSLSHGDIQDLHALHSASLHQAEQQDTLWEQTAALATACGIAVLLFIGGPTSPAEARTRLTQVCKLGCMSSRLSPCQLTDQELFASQHAACLCAQG